MKRKTIIRKAISLFLVFFMILGIVVQGNLSFAKEDDTKTIIQKQEENSENQNINKEEIETNSLKENFEFDEIPELEKNKEDKIEDSNSIESSNSDESSYSDESSNSKYDSNSLDILYKSEVSSENALELGINSNINEASDTFVTNIYLDGKSGNDDKDGTTVENAVKTFEKAKEIATTNQEIKQIVVIGATDIENDISLQGTNAKVVRGEEFNDYLFNVPGGKVATLKNIIIDGNSENNTNIEKSLVQVNRGATLNIGDGTILKNNVIKDISNTATRGGAINAYSATINMTEGSIENNQATYGGGIYLDKSIMNFSGGIVQGNNSKLVRDGGQFYSAGGGILANEGSTLNMSDDAKVLNNVAGEIGGGISLGSNQWGATNTLNMTGGTVNGNIAGAAGGGIFVQAKYFSGGASKAYISRGNITNNKMDGSGVTNKAFGGGGIYVNGANNNYGVNGANGELYLTNVLIEGNKSSIDGAGYAACPISKTKIYVTDGGAIYDNQSQENNKDLYILSSYAYGLHSGQAEYKLSKRMLGGALYNWEKLDGSALPDDKYEGKVPSYTEFALNSNPIESGKELAKASAKVIIRGNTSTTRGGGIGSNGTVTIGTGETTEVSVVKKWEDEDNADKKRPESITVQLIANVVNNKYVIEEKELNEENEWKTTFSELPTKIGDEKIEYTVKEVGEDNGLIKIEDKWFKVSYEGNMKDGFIILNKEPIPWTPMEPPYRNIKIEKKWELLGDQKPVEKIEVELYKDGIATGKKIELNASNNWIGEFEGLEVADKLGSTDYYQYTVKEVGEDNGLIKIEDKWFKVSYEGNMKDGLNIVNKYEEPNKPKQPENPKTNIPNKRNPKTGDSHSTFLYIIVIVISLLGLLLLKLRKEKNKKI